MNLHPHAGQPVLALGPPPADARLAAILIHGRGASAEECLAELMSRGTGVCGAKGGSMHLTKADAGMLGSYAVAWYGIRVNTLANARTAFASLRGKPWDVVNIPLRAGMSIGRCTSWGKRVAGSSLSRSPRSPTRGP